MSGIPLGTRVVVRTCAPGGGPGLYEEDEYHGELAAEDADTYTLTAPTVTNLALKAARNNVERRTTSGNIRLVKTAVASIASDT